LPVKASLEKVFKENKSSTLDERAISLQYHGIALVASFRKWVQDNFKNLCSQIIVNSKTDLKELKTKWLTKIRI
jgi:hypothetical protein